MTRPFEGLRPFHYRAIVADPPWRFEAWSGDGGTRAPDYATLNGQEIAALPVDKLAARDCALFLWATDPLLPLALHVMSAWGFTYKTVGFSWAKCSLDGERFPAGNGFWTRANPEICLFGVRGAPKRRATDVDQLIVAARREHSRKPDAALDGVERLVDGPYCELFARARRSGWDCWGDQVGKFGAVA